MYRLIGENVSRHPIFWIVLWVIVAAIVIPQAPNLYSVVQDGELAFLPEDSPTWQAERLFRTAFPPDIDPDDESAQGSGVQMDPLGSNIVIVLERDPRGRTTLTPEDHKFIQEVLLPALEDVKQTTYRGYLLPEDYYPWIVEEDWQVIRSISSEANERIGSLLASPDAKATLVILELKTEFLDRQNNLVLERIEKLLQDPQIQEKKPLGLSMALSGSATVGRDLLRAEKVSASRTETATYVLVVVLLLMIYRAPLLALVPLVTVGVAVALSKSLLQLMAGWGWIGLFTGLDVYVTVVVYGSGVDYCLFLIARYKEELDLGCTHQEAMAHSIFRVGGALATSAGTSIIGIAMMGLSDFGKFRQAGFAISFGLFVVLCFALTFTPAFLLIFGKWVFWPDVRRDEAGSTSGWLPTSSLWNKLQDQRWLEKAWEWAAGVISRRPATVFLTTILLMLPFAVVGVVFQENLSYGLLSDLPQDEPSVQGARVVQSHFPAGVTGPVSMFIRFDKDALNTYLDGDDLTDVISAEHLSKAITQNLLDAEQARVDAREAGKPGAEPPIGIKDLRNQEKPLGMTPQAEAYIKGLRGPGRVWRRTFGHKTYTSRLPGPLQGQVMRLDVVLDEDPFSRESIAKLGRLERAVRQAIPEVPESDEEEESEESADGGAAGKVAAPPPEKNLRSTAQIVSMGTTAGIRDLKTVTDHDRIRIDISVVISVYLVLVMLLRRPEICAYLIVSVVFSYLVTLGVTFAVFYLRDPAGFTGLDWKVPVYLFTILIAMGEDYNILLMARVQEEQEERGLVGGVLYALTKTGSIISSCGIIMAGTFCSLMTGTLLGMVQLGFALAFGVFLDTFVVRPILVPAYLIMLYSGRFGRLGRLLGAPAVIPEEPYAEDRMAQMADEEPVEEHSR